MLDTDQKQALMETLRNLSKKASSSVSTKVEANKGDFSVIITADTIQNFYKGHNVGQIRVASLDDGAIELINSDPNTAAQEMLDAFANSFDVNDFSKKAETKTAETTKEAAHDTVDEHTWQMITQKQMDDQKPSLHPRTDDYPKTVTQKQIPEDGQRPGTYEEVTEAQFAQETSTFYNEPLDAAKRKLEDRNRVTESQFEDGVKDVSEVGQSDRDRMGAKFDGDLDKQHKMIGEKQLSELLKHHEWTEPLTVTEGKEQLGKQDGELSRITAEIAEKIIKEALNAMGNTVLAAGTTPQELKSIVAKLVSHPSKYPVLADTLSRYAEKNTQAIQEKIAKAQYFGKVANANQNLSETLVADILVRQLSKLAYSPQFIVDSLVALNNRNDFTEQIDKTASSIVENKQTKTAEETNADVFNQVLNGDHEKPVIEGTDDDGKYQYTGTLDEVKASTENKDEFVKAAADYARNIVKANIDNKNIQLDALSIDVNEDLGTFKIQFKDASFKEASLETRAETRRKLAKEAQFGGGGGAPPAGGDQMGNPMAPNGGGEMGGAPPGESMSQEPPMPEDGMMGDEMGGGEPKPPGAICPVDGSEDVDVDNGEFRCNSCGAEGTISVRLEVNKWPETIQETGQEEEPGFGIGAEDDQMMDGGMGMEGPAPGGEGDGTTLPNVPIAASVRITPLLLQKVAKQNIEIGSVCPNCGGHNTDLYKSAKYKGQHGVCYDCLQEYNFQVKADRKKAHNVFAQFIWTPKVAEKNCTNCNRVHTAFAKSLSDYGMKTADFDKMSMKEKANTILAMQNSGTLNIKTAGKDYTASKYAATFKQKFEKFPSASCREKIARRFGENATAMSGPCQGKPLMDCVCNQLEDLGIYTDGIAAKVAHVVSSNDPMISNPTDTCVKMFINDNFSVKDACTVCDGLKASAATDEELMIEKNAQHNPFSPRAKPMPAPTDGMTPAKPMKPMMNPNAPKPMSGAPAPMPGAAAPMGAPADGMIGAKPMPAPPMGGGMGADPMGGGMGADPMGGGMPPKPMPGAGTQQMAAPMAADPGAAPMAAPMYNSDKGMDAGMMDPNPIDEPIMEGGEMPLGGEGDMEMPLDDAGDGHLDIEMEGDFDDTGLEMGGEMGGGMGEELGMGGGGGDPITILVKGLQDIVDALQGNIGDDMIDTTGDDMMGDDLGLEEEEGELDVGDVTEDTVDDGTDDIPGVMNDEDEMHDDLEKEGVPPEDDGGDELSMEKKHMQEEKDMKSKHMKAKHMEEEKSMKNKHKAMEAKPMEEKHVHLPVAAETEENALPKQASTDQLDQMLYHMKKGTITQSASAMDNLIDQLNAVNPDLIKSAGKTTGNVKSVEYKEAKESKLTDKAVQDSSEIGKVKGGGSMGHEESFKADSPDVPRGAATIGDEGSECTLNDSDRPSVPHGSGTMDGEGNYTPEQGNVVDGNQGGQKAAKTKNPIKVAFTVNQGHKIYDNLNTRLSEGKTSVKLTDGKEYNMAQKDSSILLSEINKVAKKEEPKPMEMDSCQGCKKPMKKCECNTNGKAKTAQCQEEGDGGGCDCPSKTAQCNCNPNCKCKADGNCDGNCGCKTATQNTEQIKESQTVSPKSVDKLEDDPDINPSSGPGAGKTHGDEAHSLGVDEKKPSEGVSEPDVPEAPDGGQLAREHTYDNKLDGPEIPAGGGTNPDYDQNEKNSPEKLDQTLGKENNNTAMAETNDERATKIAGQMLKAQRISVEQLPEKIKELSKASSSVLDDYESMMKEASTKKGLRKAAAGSPETSFQLKSTPNSEESKDLKNSIQELFRLDQRNKEHEGTADRNPRLW